MTFSYVRRFEPGKVKLSNGAWKVKPKLFQCRGNETSISLTRLLPSCDNQELKEYQYCFKLPSGDLPGLLRIEGSLFVKSGIKSPRMAADLSDPKYGRLHAVIDCDQLTDEAIEALCVEIEKGLPEVELLEAVRN